MADEEVEPTRESVVFQKRMSVTAGSTGDFAGEFDFVAVFPIEDGKQTDICKHFCQELLHAKFELFAYLSAQEDELYVLINATEDILKQFADKVDYELQLDAAVAERMMVAGSKKKQIAPVEINHFPDVTKMRPYDYIYGKFDELLDESLFKKSGEEGELFGDATKLKLIYAMVEGPPRLGGCGLPIKQLIKSEALLAFYPLHYAEMATVIKDKMSGWFTMPWNMPYTSIKKYFGEKVALYFCFLGNYSYFLLFPALAGFVFQMIVWGSGDYSSPTLPFFSVFICLWAILMLEAWKREEKRIALRWGMTNFETKELDRPEFKGQLMNSFVDGAEFKYFPEKTKTERVVYSLTVVTCMILMVIGVVTGIYVLRFAIQNTSSAPYASLVASMLNTIQIQVFNMIYASLSVRLTNYENHRTDTEFEDAMIVKSFSFQFINSYASFFFLAFIASYLAKSKAEDDDGSQADYVGQCGAETCMSPLSLNIAIIFGTRITLTNALDIGLPYYNYTEKRKAETKVYIILPDCNVFEYLVVFIA